MFLLQELEANVISFYRKELKGFKEVVSPGYPECLASQEEEEPRRPGREEALKLTVVFMRNMGQQELADTLESSESLCLLQNHMMHLNAPKALKLKSRVKHLDLYTVTTIPAGF